MNQQPREINLVCENHEPVSIPFKNFFVHSDVISQQAWSGNIQRDINYNDKYEYDSILQFSKACIDEEPKITSENVFGYYSLCDEWQVDDGVKKYAVTFMQENAQALLIKHILFQLDHNQDSSSEVKKLRENLPKYIDDPNLLKLPFEVLKEVVDFKVVEDDPESFQKVYSFCLQYLNEQEDVNNRSELFLTLNASKISYEDLSKLTGNPKFDRTKLNDSLGSILKEILNRTDAMPKTVDKYEDMYNENVEQMKAREESYKQEKQESQKLRDELKEEKEKVEILIQQVAELRNLRLNDMSAFLKEINELRENIVKEKEERDKKEKEKLEKEEEERKKERT